MEKEVKPAASLNGILNPPPDKSISHRSALFAALSDDVSIIQNYSVAADPQSTLSCLRKLGVGCEQVGDETTIKISGVGRDGFSKPAELLDCGNSGTTMRLLGGILAGAGVPSVLTGDESLSSRTMKRIIDPLIDMGCRISGRQGLYAPLQIERHDGVKGIKFPLPIPSAQLKSAVLLTGLFGEEPTEVIEKIQSRDHTERLLELHSEVSDVGRIIRSSRTDRIPAQTYTIPGDFSAAAFWLVAGVIHANSSIELKNVGINPTRTAVISILEEMGASFHFENMRAEGKEPVADILIHSAELNAINPDPALFPNCIDELPILMVAMCFAEGRSIIRGAEELRHKETDRLAAMAEIFNRSGAKIELTPDGMVIDGNRDFRPKSATYPTWHDHRIAMASAILASKSKSHSIIENAECTAISYPDFWDHLNQLTYAFKK